MNKFKDAAHDVKNDVKDAAHDAKNKVQDAVHEAKQATDEVKRLLLRINPSQSASVERNRQLPITTENQRRSETPYPQHRTTNVNGQVRKAARSQW